jgi:hypothetical protein
MVGAGSVGPATSAAGNGKATPVALQDTKFRLSLAFLTTTIQHVTAAVIAQPSHDKHQGNLTPCGAL